jgi:hypothetical protein
MLPELLGVQSYKPAEFQQKVDWMAARGFLKEKPRYTDVVRGKQPRILTKVYSC